MTLLDFALVGAGAHYVVGAAAITHPVRAWLVRRAEASGFWPLAKLVELVECPACFGFWYGWLMALSGVSPWGQSIRGALVAALAGTALVASVHGLMRRGLEGGGGEAA